MNERAALERAMMAFIEGEAEPEELALLEQAMRSKPELARALTVQLAIDSLLRQHEAIEQESFAEAVRFRLASTPEESRRFVDNVRRALCQDTLAEEDELPARCEAALETSCFTEAAGEAVRDALAKAVARGKPMSRGRLVILLAAAGAILAGIWFLWAPPTAATSPSLASPVPEESEWLAHARLSAAAKFAPAQAPEQDKLRAGTYHLLDGEVLLQFINGVQVTIRGPARWEIESAMRIKLEEGTVRVSVPEAAHGFTVSSGGTDFCDLGTEFGLQAEPAAGRRVMQVFSGAVDVVRSESREVLASLSDGQAYVVADDGAAGPSLLQPLSAFPDPQNLALSCWEKGARTRVADPSLLVYLPMWPGAEPSGVIANAAAASTGLVPEAVLAGCEWVTGRWPGKPALQFEHPGDAVRFHLPGEYTDLTVALWLKLDRVTHPWTHVWGSRLFTSRSAHLCLHGGAQMHFSAQAIMGARRKTTSVNFPHRLGSWMHVTLVLDAATRETRLYLNGQRSSCYTWSRDDWLFAPGEMTVGRFDDPADPDGREFRGRIDEFALWKRSLSDMEILDLYRDGMIYVP